jgi:HEPN domain-containing protein
MENEKLEEVKRWFDLGNRNLNTAKLLLKNQFYPDSVYYAQQASEKSVKSILNMLDEQIYEHKVATHFYDILFEKYPYDYIEEIYFLLSELETHWLKSRYILKSRDGTILDPKDLYNKKKAENLIKKAQKIQDLIKKFFYEEFNINF